MKLSLGILAKLFDLTPTLGSTKGITSGGVKTELDLKAPINNASMTGTFTLPSGALSITGGSSNNYISGTGSIKLFDASVQTATIGTLVAQNNTISNGDNFKTAINKAQGQIDAKQNTLVSGTNIKTISGISILGSGDIPLKDNNISFTSNQTLTSGSFGVNNVLTIYADAAAGGFTITLEAASTMAGRTVNVIKTDSSGNTVTVKGNGTTNINGANTYLLTSQYQNTTIKSNGTQYYIF